MGLVFEIRPQVKNTSYITGVSIFGQGEYEGIALPSSYRVVRVEVTTVEGSSRVLVTLDEIP